jgi:hypothetical protein
MLCYERFIFPSVMLRITVRVNSQTPPRVEEDTTYQNTHVVVERQENSWVPKGLETNNSSAGEGQQQITALLFMLPSFLRGIPSTDNEMSSVSMGTGHKIVSERSTVA